jgi:hypothetical protein
MMMKKPTTRLTLFFKATKNSKFRRQKQTQKREKDRKQKIVASITRYYYTLLDRSHAVLDSKTLWTDIKTL